MKGGFFMSKKSIALIGCITASLAFKEVLKVQARKNNASKIKATNQTVLITGATSGIGMELAKIFASHNFDLVFVARNEKRLNEAANEIEAQYGVNVQYIAADLAKENGAKELWNEICKRGIIIDQFVNNAGAGKSSDLVNTDEQTLIDLINLNVKSFTLLNRYISEDMVKRGGGKILNVSSLSGYLPDPGLNIYGPTKAYERYMGEAMYGELLGTNVKVSTLCPGPVKTNWSKNAGRKDSKLSLNAKDVAKAAFEGMQNGELIIIPNYKYKTLRHASNLIPTTVRIRLLRHFQNSLKD